MPYVKNICSLLLTYKRDAVSISHTLSVVPQRCSPVAEQETGGVEVVRDEVIVPVKSIT